MHWFGFRGWQVLFIVEAVPAVIFGILILFILADWPDEVSWLTPEEKQHLTARYRQVQAAKEAVRKYTVWQALRDREVL